MSGDNHQQHNDDPNHLVTRSSLALSLSPPRAPPHDSPHRMLLLGRNPSHAALSHHDETNDDETMKSNNNNHQWGIRSRIVDIFDAAHRQFQSSLHFPHPHLPAGPELADRLTRVLGVALPLPLQNNLRDSGYFRSIADTLVTISVPTMAIGNMSAVQEFVRLTNICKRIRYGQHPMQIIDLFVPPSVDVVDDGKKSDDDEEGGVRGLIFFVHGGAWGSGLPWMYRLIATRFLQENVAVSIVGYRTYPDANVDGQVDDLERAMSELSRRHPELFFKRRRRTKGRGGGRGVIGTCLMGHSSGAHIALLMLTNRVRKQMADARLQKERGDGDGDDIGVDDSSYQSSSSSFEFDSYVGLSGPYHISHHFDYEAGRGVEEISPMKAACGYTRLTFDNNSPAIRLVQSLIDIPECCDRVVTLPDRFLPPLLLLHGMEDSTVPFTATAEAARMIRSCGVRKCYELYVGNETGHQDTVMQLMLGGKTMVEVMDWLEKLSQTDKGVGRLDSMMGGGVISRSKL